MRPPFLFSHCSYGICADSSPAVRGQCNPMWRLSERSLTSTKSSEHLLDVGVVRGHWKIRRRNPSTINGGGSRWLGSLRSCGGPFSCGGPAWEERLRPTFFCVRLPDMGKRLLPISKWRMWHPQRPSVNLLPERKNINFQPYYPQSSKIPYCHCSLGINAWKNTLEIFSYIPLLADISKKKKVGAENLF